jgi:hypothetical protein
MLIDVYAIKNLAKNVIKGDVFVLCELKKSGYSCPH